MINHNDRLNTIVNEIKVFKAEQEIQILRSNQLPDSLQPNAQQGLADASSTTPLSEQALTNMLNNDVLLMPSTAQFSKSSKIWPQALAANFFQNSVSLNMIEAKGTLWKLIQRKDDRPGVRVILQTAEIGENPSHVGKKLELVDSKADAAIWNITAHVANSTSSAADAHTVKFSGDSVHGGTVGGGGGGDGDTSGNACGPAITIELEMAMESLQPKDTDAILGGANIPVRLGAGPGGLWGNSKTVAGRSFTNLPKTPLVLCCVTKTSTGTSMSSAPAAQSEIVLLQREQLKSMEQQPNPSQIVCTQFEIILEKMLSDDMEFLDGFTHTI